MRAFVAEPEEGQRGKKRERGEQLDNLLAKLRR
jgi:hypothetical protein